MAADPASPIRGYLETRQDKISTLRRRLASNNAGRREEDRYLVDRNL